jgi:hypothetical protein
MWAGRQRWAEEGKSGPAGRRERQLEQRLLNGILDHYGVHLSRWTAVGYPVGGDRRVTQLADSLSDLWAAVERIGGRRCDPLDADLLEALQSTGHK